MKNIKFSTVLLALPFILAACADQDDVHRKYVDDEETVYLRKIDSAAVYPGRERMQVQIWYTDADKLTHSIIEWSGESRTVDLSGATGSGKYTTTVELDNMPEGSYDLKIQNVNAFGQTSLYYDVFGQTYGDDYESGLSNRTIKSMTSDESGFVISWGYAADGLLYSELRFEGQTGGTAVIPAGETESSFTPRPADSKIYHRSVFKPVDYAIDEFYTEWKETEVEVPLEVECDYSLFEPLDAAYTSGFSLYNATAFADLWNRDLVEVTGSPDKATGNRGSSAGSIVTTVPWDAAFSIGGQFELTRIVLWQYGWPDYSPDILYGGGNAKIYELYGSNAPNTDGSLDATWTLITTMTIERPSGSATTDTSSAEWLQDWNAAIFDGHTFDMPQGTPAYEYLRLRCTERFGTPSTGDGAEWGLSHKMQVFRAYSE